MSLTTPLFRHHKHCDEFFARAEQAVAEGRWADGERDFHGFVAEIEGHFAIEEDVLFPAFEGATGMSGGPTQVMRMEHRQMRELIDAMAQSLATKDGDGFAGAAETLLVLMQQHNMKEENILYPMCDQAVDAGLRATIEARLAEPCHA